MTKHLRSYHLIALSVGIVLISGGAGATGQQITDLTPRIRDTSALLQKHLELLASPSQAVRIAAFHEMVSGGHPALRDLAIETARASNDKAMQALALRAGFLQVRAIVARLEPPPQPGAQSQAVIQACGEAVQYQVEGYSYERGTFEVRGQDHTGLGQVNGSTVSLAIEYGCSLSGTLQADGTLSGLVSAPYKKGSLPATIMFR